MFEGNNIDLEKDVSVWRDPERPRLVVWPEGHGRAEVLGAELVGGRLALLLRLDVDGRRRRNAKGGITVVLTEEKN